MPNRKGDWLKHAEGAPFEYYSEEEARRAISHAERIIGFCKDNLV